MQEGRSGSSNSLVDVLGATPWRRIFENPQRLSGWITFQLGVAVGSRSLEQALLSQHLAKVFCRVMKHHGPLFLAKYMKTAKLSMYKALARDPEHHFAPGGKLVPVSLSRSGLPTFVLVTHRKLFYNAPLSDRALLVARMYITALDAYKIIVLAPGPVDLSSIIEPFPRKGFYVTGTKAVKSKPIRFLAILKECIPTPCDMPLITGLGDKFMWTASPTQSVWCNSALWRDHARLGFSFYSNMPYELMARAHICWPGSAEFRRVFPSPPLVKEGVEIGWRGVSIGPPRGGVMERMLRGRQAVLQDLWKLRVELTISDLRSFIPESCCEPPVRHPDLVLPAPRDHFDGIIAVQEGRDAWLRFLGSAISGAGQSPVVVDAPPLMRLASKDEPAGKVRVFTILDSISQRLLQPLHEWLCDVLRLIPQDGTFCQLKPLSRLSGSTLFMLRCIPKAVRAATEWSNVTVEIVRKERSK